MAEAQKFAGKLGQELRDLQDRMESDDIKYILNMVISAVDLDKLDDEDIEEIGKKFEREEEVGGEEPSAEVPAEEPAVEPTSDEDLGENSMSALDEFINNPAPGEQMEISLDDFVDGSDDLSKSADLETGDDNKPKDVEKEVDLDEIKNEIHRSIGETLSKYFN